MPQRRLDARRRPAVVRSLLGTAEAAGSADRSSPTGFWRISTTRSYFQVRHPETPASKIASPHAEPSAPSFT